MSAPSPEPLRYSCPRCSAALSAVPGDIGKKRNCPSCGAAVKVPGTLSAPPAARNAPRPNSVADGAHSANVPVTTTSPSQLRVACPQCGTVLYPTTAEIGRGVTCGECLELVQVVAPREVNSSAQPSAGPPPAGGHAGKSARTAGRPTASKDPAKSDPAAIDPARTERRPPPPPARAGGLAADLKRAQQELDAQPDRHDREDGRQRTRPPQVTEPGAEPDRREPLPPPSPVSEPRAKQLVDPSLEERVTYSCPVCDTRLDAKRRHIGKSRKCPDCGSQVEVPASSRPAARVARSRPALRGADETQATGEDAQPAALTQFSFDCPICQSKIHAAVHDVGDKRACPDCLTQVTVPHPTADAMKHCAVWKDEDSLAPSGPVDDRTVPKQMQVYREQASQYMKKAEAELREEQRDEKEFVGKTDSSILLKFFTQPATFSRWLLSALGMAAVVSAAHAIAALSSFAGAVAGVSTLLSLIIWMLVTLLGCCYLTAVLMAILKDTASAHVEIETWPDWGFVEWLPDSLIAMASLMLAGMPGAIIHTGMSTLNVPLFGLPVLLTTYLFYPFITLSMMTAESVLVPFSGKVYDSMFTRGAQHWLWFYVLTGTMLIPLAGCLALFAFSSLLVHLIGALGCVGLMFVYHRALGWLSWRLAAGR